MILDEHSNKATFSTVQNDYYGLKLFVGSPDEFPAMKDRSILVKPGHENFVEASGYVVKSSSAIRDLVAKDRNCFFPDEGNLDFHDQYSYSSCKFECSLTEAEELVGCIPWYLPQGQNSTACDPWSTRQFSRMLGEVSSDKELCSNCLPDCEITKTSFVLSSARFRSVYSFHQ